MGVFRAAQDFHQLVAPTGHCPAGWTPDNAVMIPWTNPTTYLTKHRAAALLLLGCTTLPLAAASEDGLVLHLDAGKLSQAGPLPVWPDLSGQGHDVYQMEPAQQPEFSPEFAGSRPAVVFHGQQWMDGPVVLPLGAKSLTYVAVWQRRDVNGSQSVLEQAEPGVGHRAALLTTDTAYGFNGEYNDQHFLLPYRPGVFAVSILRLFPDGRVTLLHNGYRKSGFIDVAKQEIGADRLRIGGKIYTDGERLDGAIQEIQVYDRALTDDEADQLSADLIKKWGIQVEPTHPEFAPYIAQIQRFTSDPNRYSEPYRPKFHFTPIEGWMNDPNGLVFFHGQWHLFYQHAVWGWGHAVSADLVHWQHRLPALTPDELGAIFSGSAVVDEHDTSGFFGGQPGIVCIYTYHNPAEGNRQSIAIAYSADGVSFAKYQKNPVIPQLRFQPDQPDDANFRDPKVFWHEPTQRWIMVVAGGTLRFYSSANLRDWTFESINPDISTECPDFFPLPVEGSAGDVKWVLSGAGAWYRLGTFDGHRFTPETDQLRFNYGRDFYAAQTWSDAPGGRRLMLAWLYNYEFSAWPTSPWSGGGMTVPYELKLRTTAGGPRVFSNPVPEMESLRGSALSFDAKSVEPGDQPIDGVTGKALEIDAEFDVSGAASSFGFKIPRDGPGQTVVGYDVAAKTLFVDRRTSGHEEISHFPELFSAPLPPQNQRVKMRILLDASSVEVFGNDGEAVITACILPDPMNDGLSLFAEGGNAKLVSLKVYPLPNIWREPAQPK